MEVRQEPQFACQGVRKSGGNTGGKETLRERCIHTEWHGSPASEIDEQYKEVGKGLEVKLSWTA